MCRHAKERGREGERKGSRCVYYLHVFNNMTVCWWMGSIVSRSCVDVDGNRAVRLAWSAVLQYLWRGRETLMWRMFYSPIVTLNSMPGLPWVAQHPQR